MNRCLSLLFCLLLASCASNARLKQVRSFTAEAPSLAAFSDLSQRFRDTYQREQPYLSPQAAEREAVIDRKRHEAYPDFIALEHAAALYLQALDALAAGDAFDLRHEVKGMAEGIKAWPDTGLTDRHVDAYSGLTRLLVRAAGMRQQDLAVQAMLREGYQPLQDTLDAMLALLGYFDKNHDNEQRIVLGMLEVEIPYAEAPQQRLLAALARSHQQEKQREYRLFGLRHTLAAQHIAAMRAQLAALVQGLDAPASAAPATLPVAAQQGAQP